MINPVVLQKKEFVVTIFHLPDVSEGSVTFGNERFEGMEFQLTIYCCLKISNFILAAHEEAVFGIEFYRSDDSLIGKLITFPEVAIKSEQAFVISKVDNSFFVLDSSPILKSSLIDFICEIPDFGRGKLRL